MKAILALGNPGDRYRDTRHNVGWWLADRLVRAWGLPPFRPRGRAATSEGTVAGGRVEIWKPLTYVNRSGDVLGALGDRGVDPGADLLVLVDDVSLEPGTLRLRARGSSGGHRGLASVEGAAGTDAYARLRIGVGRPPDERIDLAEWVLAPMTAAEEEKVVATFGRAVEVAEVWLEKGVDAAMTSLSA